jgi:hypothetical protein
MTPAFSYETRRVLRFSPEPAINAGYQHWFPELRAAATPPTPPGGNLAVSHGACARGNVLSPASAAGWSEADYPKGWFPELAARLREPRRPSVLR